MFKKLLVILALILAFPVVAQAELILLPQNVTGKVVQVIDGESIKVEVTDTGLPALVKLIGVECYGSDDAYNFLNSKLLGKTVALSFDPNVTRYYGRMNQMYAYLGEEMVNKTLITKGYGLPNEYHKTALMFNEITTIPTPVRTGGYYDENGLFKTYEIYTPTEYSGSFSADALNINTASHSQLSALYGGSVASSIIDYRYYNPFNTVKELKFVDGMTKELFDRNKKIVVATNINRADEAGLLTLMDFAQSDVNRIIDFRRTRSFTDIAQLHSEGLISRRLYDRNEPFISTKDVSEITLTYPDVTVNINTASHSQLVSAGLTSSEADVILDYRKYYSFKNLDELEYIPFLRFNKRSIDRLSDNLTTDSYAGDYVNINTAQRAQLESIGMSYSQVDMLLRSRGRMENGKQIPFDVTAYDKRVTLFTNINLASESELKTLSTQMDEHALSEIVSYRGQQPFGSLGEFRDFMSSIGKSELYNQISSYVVVR